MIWLEVPPMMAQVFAAIGITTTGDLVVTYKERREVRLRIDDLDAFHTPVSAITMRISSKKLEALNGQEE